MRLDLPDDTVRRHRRQSVVMAVLSTVVVLVLLCLPGGSLEGDVELPFTFPSGSDKVGHAALFFVETRFLRRAFLAVGWSWPLVFALGGAMILAALTETLQLVVPGRDGNGYDLMADAVGAGLYAGIFTIFRRSSGRNQAAETL